MKRFQTLAFAFALIMTSAMLSCNDPLQIGTELLEDSDVNFVSTDTITVEALTTQLDSIIAYQSPNFVFSSQRLGWVGDPIFGNHRADIFLQVVPESVLRPVGEVDSVVLAIEYDTVAIYGNPNSTFDFQVFSPMEQVSRFDTYYTDKELAVTNSWGNINGFVRTESDSIQIVEINGSGDLDTMNVLNQMRLKLDNALGTQIMGIDSAEYAVTDSFLTVFSGLLVRPTVVGGGMLPLRISANSKLNVYYKDASGNPRQYDYFVGGATFSLHDHDFSTGTIDGAINSPQLSEDLLYMQGAGGPLISVKFPHIKALNNIVVNEAILELTTAILPQDNRSNYPLPTQLYTSFREGSTVLLTPDIATAIQGFNDVSLAGGRPVEVSSGGSTQVVYRLNISDHIQSMIEGTVSDEIFIQLALSSNGVERAIFKGINDSESPIRLKITYTDI